MLTERQKRILWAVIDDYIASAEPVGSRTVSKKKEVGVSAATIRNEMADLEEMGYLEQPYTSAGRIPSQKGYRFYVDHIVTPYFWQQGQSEELGLQDWGSLDSLEQIIRQTATLLSKQTNYMTITLGPTSFEERLRYLQVVPLSSRHAISIIITETGRVYQQQVEIPQHLTELQIQQIVQIVNERLQGQLLSPFLAQGVSQQLELGFDLDEWLTRLFHMENSEQVYTSGTTRILDQPEFQDINKMRALLDLLEETQTIMQLIQPTSDGIQVRIGKENVVASVSDCSIISASIMIHGEQVGTIGVLGPTRMNYRKVIGLIDYLSRDVSDKLHRWLRGL
ncbi:heat-inducible transcription repressor HrcA [Seinonella peptonophila]|uniref:Heat-inducible transcription repressor HrcA n=1 Tax=Seinonella peptonophila TaxID=112248 RepID=A0A1M4V8K3_9BACL|nr:heat-inducible transcriptional repressor HrcA [Seinonella peptonophila]SHE65295.1 heat-inducible transcription repressor HrcA [Seinonella peptonophila]